MMTTMADQPPPDGTRGAKRRHPRSLPLAATTAPEPGRLVAAGTAAARGAPTHGYRDPALVERGEERARRPQRRPPGPGRGPHRQAGRLPPPPPVGPRGPHRKSTRLNS